ncbi:unnamed protein product [Cylindrotheca closterium]|uniref:DDE Tnp4 domain-containing protein n=1 Tax=Cylindrotheca closterium TaxID=2856 RepID=A0AAD2FWJ7_9STRA|nr:unnamed protein product [Cylindrotheca closterium]
MNLKRRKQQRQNGLPPDFTENIKSSAASYKRTTHGTRILRLVEAAGLDVHCGAAMDFLAPEKQKQEDQVPSRNIEEASRPSIKPNALTSMDVNCRIGFQDFPTLLSYAIVVCGGDLDRLFKTCSKLTWLEEWLFYFEFKYGRTTGGSWQDYEKMYKTSQKPLGKILLKKWSLELGTRDQWPMYASHEEDVTFCDRKWNEYFNPATGERERERERVVMHDATGIPLPCPSKSELQRALFSDYYGTTWVKAGVSHQLCGWIRGMPLMTGRITDSQMIKDSEILVVQRKFSEADTSSKEPLNNIFDKGFGNTLVASMEGQTCTQPTYSKGGTQSSGKATLYSACVAVIRSGNERAVQRCKMSWFLKLGYAYQLLDIELFLHQQS